MLHDKQLFLLDIDGTVSVDATLFDGAAEFFSRIRDKGGKYIFITNNSTKSVKDYVLKFTRMGVAVDESSFVTASTAAIYTLTSQYYQKKIFLLGTSSLQRELEGAGICVTKKLEEDIAAALVGFDDELRYDKLRTLCELLYTHDNVPYLATNPDLCCPVTFGAIPDCGAICGMIRCATGREPVYLGKPNPLMVDMCLRATGFSKSQTLVIGDRLYTDIACGLNAGVDTAVVFTGEAKKEDLAHTPYPPRFSFPSIKELSDAVFKH